MPCGPAREGLPRPLSRRVVPVVTASAVATAATRHQDLDERVIPTTAQVPHRHTESARDEAQRTDRGFPVRVMGARVRRRMAAVIAKE